MPYVLYRLRGDCWSGSEKEAGQRTKDLVPRPKSPVAKEGIDIRAVYRSWLRGWIASIAILGGLALWIAADAIPALTAVVLAALALEVLFRTLRLPSGSFVRLRTGYWFIGPGPTTSLHFLPPRDLAIARHTQSIFEARTELEHFLARLGALGIRTLYAETNLLLLGRVGFRRTLPASPLSWISIALQHHAATGRWNWRWPWLFIYGRP